MGWVIPRLFPSGCSRAGMKPGVPWSNPGGHLQESAFQGLEIIPALLEARAGLAMDDPVGLVILRAVVSHSCVCALLKEPNDHSLIILGIKTSQSLGSWELCCQQSFSLSQITERRFWKKHGGRQLRGRIPEHSTSMLNKKKLGRSIFSQGCREWAVTQES